MAKKPAKTTTTTKKTTAGGTKATTTGKHATTASKPAAKTTASGKKTTTTTSGKRAATSTSGSSGTRSIKKQPAPAKKAAAPAKLAGAPLAGHWLTGIGDERDVCAAIAVGNSLLAVLGVRASDADIERLYRAAGGHGDSGTPVEAVLAAASETGIAGCRLRSWHPAAAPSPGGVALLSLDVTPDLHAAAFLGDGAVATWGDTVPLTDLSARIDGAWSLTWHR